MEYNSNMELEEGDLQDDAAAAGGASGTERNIHNRTNSNLSGFLPCSFQCQIRGNIEPHILEAFLFLKMLRHVLYTNYCSRVPASHWLEKKWRGLLLNILKKKCQFEVSLGTWILRCFHSSQK